MKLNAHYLSWLVLIATSLLSFQTSADDFVWAPAFEVGDKFPAATLNNQQQEPVDVGHNIEGKGQLIAFNRSVVW